MVRAAVHALLLLAFLSSAASAGTNPSGAAVWNGSRIAWRTAAEGFAEAKRDGKLALVIVQTDWCPVCRKYREVFNDARVVEKARNFVLILMDGDTDAEADSAFAPDGTYVPRTLFVDGDGRIVASLKAEHPKYRHFVDSGEPGELLELMKRAAARRSARE